MIVPRLMLLIVFLWSRPIAPAAPTLKPDQLMLQIAAGYSQWGRVDDVARWAPFLCSVPIRGVHRFSQSDDPETHGQKIYALYARNRDAYVALNDALPKDFAPQMKMVDPDHPLID